MSKYTLLNQVIDFEDAEERFFDIQYTAQQAISAISQEFQAWYKSRENILNVLNGYEEESQLLIAKYTISPLFDTLTALEIYDISRKVYEDYCLDYSERNEALSIVANNYNAILEEQESAMEYREERKASRDRVIGGGFGVGGALKGMVAAGTMNALSGAGHSLVNAIGNAGSAIAASSAKKSLYDNIATIVILYDAIKKDALSAFDAHINLINERKSNYIVSCFDSDKSKALFESAKKVEHKAQELLIEAVKYCPWDKDLLAYIFENYAGERKHVWLIAQRFHVDLAEAAENVFKSIYSGKACESEEEAKAARQEILSIMEELNIEKSETLNQLEQDCITRLLKDYPSLNSEEKDEVFALVNAFDANSENKALIIRKRKVWELAKQYHVVFSAEEVEDILQKVYDTAAQRSEDKAIVAKKQILAIMKQLSVEESITLDKLEKDCLARVCAGYQTADEETCNTIVTKLKAYDALDKNKKEFFVMLQQRIEEIWSAEDGEIFDNVYLNTDILDSQKVQEAIEFIKSKGRTSASQKYLDALKACTPENIKKAQKYNASFFQFLLWTGGILLFVGCLIMFLGLGIILGMAINIISIITFVYAYKYKKNWEILTIQGTIVHPALLMKKGN